MWCCCPFLLSLLQQTDTDLPLFTGPAAASPESPLLLLGCGRGVGSCLVALVDDGASRTGTLILAPGTHRIVPAVPAATVERLTALRMWSAWALFLTPSSGQTLFWASWQPLLCQGFGLEWLCHSVLFRVLTNILRQVLLDWLKKCLHPVGLLVTWKNPVCQGRFVWALTHFSQV